jgi:hypothetical protein
MDVQYSPSFRVLFSTKGLNTFVFDNLLLPGHKRALVMQHVFKRCMIRRTVTSRIPLQVGPRIGDAIPPVHLITIQVKFTSKEMILFRKIRKPLLDDERSFVAL